MRAIQIERHGGPEVLQYRTNVPEPDITEDQVLIRVAVAGVNPTDTWTRDGAYPDWCMRIYVPSFPWTPGRDVAGTVERVGSKVSRLKAGDRVYTSCMTLSGGYAELVAAPEREAFPLPDAISFRDGACIGIPYFTAYRAVHTRGQLKPGETVLVHGASGGVGLAAVQLAVGHGCRVLGTAGSQQGLDLVRAQGAHAVFNHREAGYIDKIKEFVGDAGVNMIVEFVADVNMNADVKLLAKFGRIMVIGTTAWNSGSLLPRYLYMGELDIRGVAIGVQDDFTEEFLQMHHFITQGFSAGWLKAVVGQEFPLERAREAQIEVREHKQGSQGNIIINI